MMRDISFEIHHLHFSGKLQTINQNGFAFQFDCYRLHQVFTAYGAMKIIQILQK